MSEGGYSSLDHTEADPLLHHSPYKKRHYAIFSIAVLLTLSAFSVSVYLVR